MKLFTKYAAPPLILIFILCLFSFGWGEKIQINRDTATRYIDRLLSAMDTEIDALRVQSAANKTLANSIRTQVVGSKVLSQATVATYNSSGTVKASYAALYYLVDGVFVTWKAAFIGSR